jgi:hypothetical protein
MISYTKRLLRDIWLPSQDVNANGRYACLSIRLGGKDSVPPQSISFFSVERRPNARQYVQSSVPVDIQSLFESIGAKLLDRPKSH